MSVEDFTHAVSPPKDHGVVGAGLEWGRVEELLGTTLPWDYKELVSRYGAGCIDGFVWVLSPFAKNDNLNLISQSQVRVEALRQLRDEYNSDIPYPLFPSDEGLFPWAFTDNGDVLYLRYAEGQLRQPVVIGDSGGADWKEFDGNVTDFLTALFTRRFRVPFFPAEFPSDEPEFVLHN